MPSSSESSPLTGTPPAVFFGGGAEPMEATPLREEAGPFPARMVPGVMALQRRVAEQDARIQTLIQERTEWFRHYQDSTHRRDRWARLIVELAHRLIPYSSPFHPWAPTSVPLPSWPIDLQAAIIYADALCRAHEQPLPSTDVFAELAGAEEDVYRIPPLPFEADPEFASVDLSQWG